MQAKHATSLRVDQARYDKLATLAKARKTSSTRQLELAIRRHLEGAVVEDYLPILEPVIERVVRDAYHQHQEPDYKGGQSPRQRGRHSGCFCRGVRAHGIRGREAGDCRDHLRRDW